MRAVRENMACLERLEKQKKFLKSKGKDMVRRSLKTLDELEEAEEKEKQIEEERAANETAASLFHASAPEADPFAGIEIPLLPPEV
jgi:CO dehydrogenase/acetyl-CoA synthase beta subunit